MTRVGAGTHVSVITGLALRAVQPAIEGGNPTIAVAARVFRR
jgi:hypothetical protein